MPVKCDEAAVCRRVFESVPRQVDLARRLGLTSSAISNLKKRQRCTLGLVIAAAEITGKPVEWFLFGDAADRGRPRGRGRAPAPTAGETARKSSALLVEELLVAEEEAPYGSARAVRTLLCLYEQRISTLEEAVRALTERLARIEGTAENEQGD